MTEMTGIKQLKEMIENSDNIVFFGGGGYLQRVESRISEVWTAYIIKNMIIRRRPY